MQSVDSSARILSELIHHQSVTRSAVGTRAREALEPLFHAGALKEERSGAGWRIVVVNPEAVERFADINYPHGLDRDDSRLDRAEAVAMLRDAKRGANRTGEPVLIRGFSSAVLESSRGEVDVRSLTKVCGCASFVLSGVLQYSYRGDRVALVENLEPFLRFDDRFNGYDAAIYCAGRMSTRFLLWLGKQKFDVVHFGDYDPVGLQEFLRLKDNLGGQASLFIPDNLNDLVQRYGKPSLMRGSTAIISTLRMSKDPSVKDVLKCLDDFGAGLEQEILWANLEGE